MSIHAFNLLQTKLLYMFCSTVEPLILAGLQQTKGYHILRLYSLVMLLCAVVVCFAQSLLFGHIKLYFL